MQKSDMQLTAKKEAGLLMDDIKYSAEKLGVDESVYAREIIKELNRRAMSKF